MALCKAGKLRKRNISNDPGRTGRTGTAFLLIRQAADRRKSLTIEKIV
jgi:hypothetical protein